MSVQQEVTRALARPEDFLDVPPGLARLPAQDERARPRHATDARPAWVVRDGQLHLGALAR
jgi:hypothetical protein